MTVEEFAKFGSFEIAAGSKSLKREITGGYCGDLLSWVMAHAASGDVWASVIGNINAVAVAMLTDVACLILADNANLDDEAKKRADEKDVAVLKSDKSVFEIAILTTKALKL